MARSGRLTFSGRSEYVVVSVYGLVGGYNQSANFAARVTGYAAKCTCALGDHYLIQYPNGFVSECTSDRGAVPDECVFLTANDAQAAIAAWQAQHERQDDGGA